MAKFFTDLGVFEDALSRSTQGAKKIVEKVENVVTSGANKEPPIVVRKNPTPNSTQEKVPPIVVKRKTDSNLTQEKEKVEMETAKNKELTLENESLKTEKDILSKNVETLKKEKEDFITEINYLNAKITSLENEIASARTGKMQELDSREAELDRRETEVSKKETDAKNGFELLKAQSMKEIEMERAKKMSELDEYVSEARKSITSTQSEIDENKKQIIEQSAALAQKETKLVVEVTKKWEDFLAKQQEVVSSKFMEILENQKNNSLAQITDLSEREKTINARELAVTERETAVLARENDANGGFRQKENELRVREAKVAADEEKNENLKNTLMEAIESRISIEREALNDELQNVKARHKEEIDSLNEKLTDNRNEINSLTKQIDEYEKIFLKYGSDSSSFTETINAKDEMIKGLQQAANSRSLDSQNRIGELNKQIEELKRDNSMLRQEKESHYSDSEKISNLQLEISNWERKFKNIEEDNISLKALVDSQAAKLKQISELYERNSEREARIKDIEVPVIKQETLPKLTNKYNSKASSESEWLENIQDNFEKYEFQVHPRLLKSFHTSLKSADMSPITVLAGVSGTGKSELPKLYSHFGGLNFMNTPVQPNWDCQESMLGFFNTIDNKFDAHDILKFLVQAQKDGDNSLKDYVNLALLDEMNLAHIELYFAEFLSRLEERRDRSDLNLPSLPVNLGAGIPPYPLKLSRNVLWVGTMNQDETTKTLSDKVLDRGIIINFPRPKELINITKRCSLEDEQFKQKEMLPVTVWNDWKKNEPLGDALIDPYKKFIENMNDKLAVVGRSVGHRVWQSVVRYMENYPDVRLLREQGKTDKDLKSELDIAFEDQLVQKIMPKLRGIETRGVAKKDCLDEIAKLIGEFSLDHNLKIGGDFKTACEIGEGQFFWSGAEYLGPIPSKEKKETN